MFKNANLYRLLPHWPAVLGQVEDALQCAAFVPCGPTQASSSGWAPPRAANGLMVESVGGQWIAKLVIETKSVPADAVKSAVAERIEKYKQETGRERVGSKIKKEFKEEVILELLPRAFPRKSAVLVWINPADSLLVVDAASHAKADAAVSALVQAIEGFGVRPLQTSMSPTAAMSHWLLSNDVPEPFCIARDCELQALDDTKASVRYARHALDNAEVIKHIYQGKSPTRLAMLFDDRLSFVLGGDMTIRRLEFLDVVTESKPSEEDAFDADVVIATGELNKFIPALIQAFGGELEQQPELSLVQPEEGCSGDVLYDQAVALVLKHQKASISLVQRHLKIGYNRAARLLEQMEKDGKITAMDATGARALITD